MLDTLPGNSTFQCTVFLESTFPILPHCFLTSDSLMLLKEPSTLHAGTMTEIVFHKMVEEQEAFGWGDVFHTKGQTVAEFWQKMESNKARQAEFSLEIESS